MKSTRILFLLSILLLWSVIDGLQDLSKPFRTESGAPVCLLLSQMLVNNNCVSVKCKSDASCQASHTNYCVKAGFGKPLCNRNKYCECFSPFKPRKPPTRTHGTAIFRCRRDADDNDGCPANKVCHPNGFCVDKTSCQYHGGSCSSTFKCCHDRETKLYCHTRSFSSKPLCLKNAFVRESCASGIPCEYGSVCMPNKICSLRETDACDAPGSVCPPKSKCKHASAAEGVNKVCVPY